MTPSELCIMAINMTEKSYAPYSHYTVGAALLTESGKVYTGCNIENASYTPTVCAERTAFFKAVSDGEKAFEAIAVAGGKDKSIKGSFPPCGVCRQVMAEFCNGDFSIYVVTDSDGNYIEYKLKDLLPFSFTNSNMQV